MSTPVWSEPPALVEPGAELGVEEIARYSRHILIPGIGAIGQRRLCAARVLVVGAGGLGSPILQYLAAAGVGTIGIVDFDHVELSNLQRQVIHASAPLGAAKVDSAADAVRQVNPLVRVDTHRVRLTSANALEIVRDYDLVLDGTDNFATRYLVNDACAIAGKPYVWGSIFRFEGQVSVFWAGFGPTYRDVFPSPPPPGSVPSCAEGGVLGVLCATIGSLMATEAIKLICGLRGGLLGRMLIYDALAMTFRTVTIGKDPQAAPITTLIDYDEFCGAGPRSAGEAAEDTGEISAADLHRRIEAGADVLIVDVREPAEYELGAIAGAVLIPQAHIRSGDALGELPRDRDIVLYCRSGARSAACLAKLREAGFTRVHHLAGGILAWATDFAPELPRY